MFILCNFLFVNYLMFLFLGIVVGVFGMCVIFMIRVILFKMMFVYK